LLAGLTLGNILPQSEVHVNITYIPTEARLYHYAKIKEAISPFFLMCFYY